MNKFEMTREGCALAKQYLIDIDKINALEKELSLDGYTLVTLANSFYEKNSKKLDIIK